MIPVRYLQRLGAKVVDRRRLRSSTTISYPVDIYAVALTVGPFTQATLEVIGNRQSDDIIVGWDVLNHMIVTLNGLANVVELSYCHIVDGRDGAWVQVKAAAEPVYLNKKLYVRAGMQSYDE